MKSLKKSIIALCLMAALGACSHEKNTETTKNTTASTPVAASEPVASNLPVYRVRLAKETYPPFNILDGKGSYTGLEIDIMDAIAKNQNFKFEYVPYVFEIIFQNMDKDQHDVVGGGLSVEDIDADVVTPSKPYMHSDDCVVGNDADAVKNWTSKKIAVVTNDEIDERLIKQFGVKRNNIKQSVRTQFEALKMVANNTSDVTISDCTVLKYFIKEQFKDHPFVVQALPLPEKDAASYDLVLNVRKDQTELLNKINAGIENIQKNGELDAILKRWQ